MLLLALKWMSSQFLKKFGNKNFDNYYCNRQSFFSPNLFKEGICHTFLLPVVCQKAPEATLNKNQPSILSQYRVTI